MPRGSYKKFEDDFKTLQGQIIDRRLSRPLTPREEKIMFEEYLRPKGAKLPTPKHY